MPPEMVKRIGYGEKADVWSLGILLYEMLHGYAPFHGRKDQDTMSKIIENNLVFAASIQDDAKNLIKQMLKEDPKERPEVIEVFVHPWMKRIQKEFKIKDNDYVEGLAIKHPPLEMVEKESPASKEKAEVVSDLLKDVPMLPSSTHKTEDFDVPVIAVGKLPVVVKPESETPQPQPQPQPQPERDNLLSSRMVDGVDQEKEEKKVITASQIIKSARKEENILGSEISKVSLSSLVVAGAKTEKSPKEKKMPTPEKKTPSEVKTKEASSLGKAKISEIKETPNGIPPVEKRTDKPAAEDAKITPGSPANKESKPQKEAKKQVEVSKKDPTAGFGAGNSPSNSKKTPVGKKAEFVLKTPGDDAEEDAAPLFSESDMLERRSKPCVRLSEIFNPKEEKKDAPRMSRAQKQKDLETRFSLVSDQGFPSFKLIVGDDPLFHFNKYIDETYSKPNVDWKEALHDYKYEIENLAAEIDNKLIGTKLENVEEGKEALNDSYSSDDYAFQRSETVRKAVQYLDDIDSNQLVGKTDEAARNIAKENLRLKKVCGGSAEDDDEKGKDEKRDEGFFMCFKKKMEKETPTAKEEQKKERKSVAVAEKKLADTEESVEYKSSITQMMQTLFKMDTKQPSGNAPFQPRRSYVVNVSKANGRKAESKVEAEPEKNSIWNTLVKFGGKDEL